MEEPNPERGDPDASEDADDPTQLSETMPGIARDADAAGIPARIGPYEILGELGRGGMGVVYVALDPALERRVALKIFPERMASHPALFAQFQREAKLLASINNPNIATIHSLEEAAGTHFLTMEMIPGRSLAERIQVGPLAIDETLQIGRQIAGACEAAHKSGIAHLDLKPQNVMVTPEGVVKVLDFGIAMALGRESDESGEARTLSREQEIAAGTPGYMSPEQLRREAVDSRADIWAFGCILYECLTARLAFPGETWQDRVRATLEGAPDPRALPDDTPPRLQNLLGCCLVRDLDRRLDTITKARREIEEEIALRALPAVKARSEVVPNNLPIELARFIGRERQKADARALLEQNRLVTLTGVGGGGKTRLAIEVGRETLDRFPDGIWFVEMAPLASPDLVPAAVATALKLPGTSVVPPTETVAEHLRSRNALLILDNCEHLIDAIARLAATLLAACPGLRILATSRQPLGILGEASYHVPPLAVPGARDRITAEELRRIEAARLFETRACSVSPEFALTDSNAPAVAQICRHLEGIPLAIELAAARIKVLPAEEIARRLDDRFRLLTSANRAALPHHQTLRALIDWSYEHLSEAEQTLLRRLSLFTGGWSLDAAEAVCAGDRVEEWDVLDLLSSLVDKSLAETDVEGGQTTGRPRYRMLETIREYAHARLIERKEGSETLERHRGYYLALSEEAESRLTGPDQAVHLLRLSAEHENLRLAMDMCAAPEADPELGWRLAGALGRYWYIRGHWNEARKVLAELMSRPDAPRETAAAASALNWAGNLASLQGDRDQARAYLEESLAIRRRLGDERGAAASLHNLANIAKDRREYDEARTLYEEALALQKKLGNSPGIALTLSSLGFLAYLQGKRTDSLALHEESLRLQRELGDRRGIAASLSHLGIVAEELGNAEQAAAYLEESLTIRREMGDRRGVAASVGNLGRLAEAGHDLARARSCYEEALAILRDLGDKKVLAIALNNLGLVHASEGDHARARELLEESLSLLRSLNDRSSIPSVMRGLGWIASDQNDPERAARLLGASETIRAEAGIPLAAPESERLSATIARLRAALGPEGFAAAWKDGESTS